MPMVARVAAAPRPPLGTPARLSPAGPFVTENACPPASRLHTPSRPGPAARRPTRRDDRAPAAALAIHSAAATPGTNRTRARESFHRADGRSAESPRATYRRETNAP